MPVVGAGSHAPSSPVRLAPRSAFPRSRVPAEPANVARVASRDLVAAEFFRLDPRDARARPRANMTVAAGGATKLAKPEPASVPGVRPRTATRRAPAISPPRTPRTTRSGRRGSHAVVLRRRERQGARGAPNGQQAAAYYAQMAQPNLYAQMWANPVRSAPHSRHSPAPLAPSARIRANNTFPVRLARISHGVTTSPAERPPRGVLRPIFHSKPLPRFSRDFGKRRRDTCDFAFSFVFPPRASDG